MKTEEDEKPELGAEDGGQSISLSQDSEAERKCTNGYLSFAQY